MVLADTSVWVDHFCRGDKNLEYLLNESQVATHPYVIGELACGNIRNRKLIFSLLNALPSIPEVAKEEFSLFLDRHRLFGMGLGFVDIHLLASTLVSECIIYTHDKSLLSSAKRFGIAYM